MIRNRDSYAQGEPFWHFGRIGSAGCLYIFKDERGYCPGKKVHLDSLDEAKSWHLKNIQFLVD